MLAGKCAVVVGGTSGIGEAISLGLAAAGADVVATQLAWRGADLRADHAIQESHELAKCLC